MIMKNLNMAWKTLLTLYVNLSGKNKYTFLQLNVYFSWRDILVIKLK